MKIDALIGLYPRRWRVRYGDELAALVANRPVTASLAFDLIVGAIDAWMQPRPITLTEGKAAAAGGGGGLMTTPEPTIFEALKCCEHRLVGWRGLAIRALIIGVPSTVLIVLWSRWLDTLALARPWDPMLRLAFVALLTAFAIASDLPPRYRLRTRLAMIPVTFGITVVCGGLAGLIAFAFTRIL